MSPSLIGRGETVQLADGRVGTVTGREFDSMGGVTAYHVRVMGGTVCALPASVTRYEHRAVEHAA